MATACITVSIRVAWWVRPALHCIAWYSRLTSTTPDLDKATVFLMHGIKLRIG